MSDRDEWWNDWRDATVVGKWNHEMTTNVEALYQAFKARLMEELIADARFPNSLGGPLPLIEASQIGRRK